jgi:hypothetical protein
MRMIADRRARADVAGLADIGAGLQRAGGQLWRARIAGIEGELGGGGRNVDD